MQDHSINLSSQISKNWQALAAALRLYFKFPMWKKVGLRQSNTGECSHRPHALSGRRPKQLFALIPLYTDKEKPA